MGTNIEDGYEARPFSVERQANCAFFPAYPLFVKYVAEFFSADVFFVGCILATLSYLLVLYILLHLLALDFDRETTFRSLLLLAFYPFAFGLVAFGPDSFFLLAICLSFYCARKERWLLAGLIAGIASATRPQGVLLGVPLLYMYLRKRKNNETKITSEFLWLLWIYSLHGIIVLPIPSTSLRSLWKRLSLLVTTAGTLNSCRYSSCYLWSQLFYGVGCREECHWSTDYS